MKGACLSLACSTMCVPQVSQYHHVCVGSWLHVPPASCLPSSPHPLAPATPPKPTTSMGGAGGTTGQAGGCQPVDERLRASACALEVSVTKAVNSAPCLEPRLRCHPVTVRPVLLTPPALAAPSAEEAANLKTLTLLCTSCLSTCLSAYTLGDGPAAAAMAPCCCLNTAKCMASGQRRGIQEISYSQSLNAPTLMFAC